MTHKGFRENRAVFRNSIPRTLMLITLGCVCCLAAAAEPVTNFVCFETNTLAIQKVSTISYYNVQSNIVKTFLRTNNGVRMPERIWGLTTNVFTMTNRTFEAFVPGSLPHTVWTNFLVHSPGRTTQMWSERQHPLGWPVTSPTVKWNRKSLVYGMRGFTAISPCWESEGSSGQLPVTALTRRHGYTRGHGMGNSGAGQKFAGKQVWFVAADDRLVEVRVKREIVRTEGRDYTILIFDRDLPESIQPMRVMESAEFQKAYQPVPGAPHLLFLTEQGGHVSAQVKGFTVNTWKGGDSGSPNMLPLPGELVFVGGRSTSGPSKEMQADMNELCRLQRLRPERYQMQWVRPNQ